MKNTRQARDRLGKSAQLLVALLGFSTVILGCGVKSPSSSASAAKAPPSDLGATSKRDRTPLGKTTLRMTYELVFADSTGQLEIWIDGDFLKIDETWKRSEAVPSLRWGTTRARMLFDRKTGVLVIINLENNTFTRVNSERIAAENELLLEKPRMPLGMTGAEPAQGDIVEAEATPAKPTPLLEPTQQHPKGCAAYARALAHGLSEETCFKSRDRMGLSDIDVKSLLSFFALVRELKGPPSELSVAADIAETFGWEHGVLVSRREYGSSPFGTEGNTVGLEPWDVIVRLKDVRQVAPNEDDFSIPKNTEEKFSLLPWKRMSLF